MAQLSMVAVLLSNCQSQSESHSVAVDAVLLVGINVLARFVKQRSAKVPTNNEHAPLSSS